jgi:hypothetical protein
MPSDAESLEAQWLPPINEDWFGRPIYGGAFAGLLMGDELISSEVALEPGLLTGIRIGQDWNRRWACETRFAYAMPEVINLQGPELRRDADIFFADTTLIYSRYATNRLRPYLSAGLGMAYVDFVDHRGESLAEFVPTVPLGVGLQYRHADWMVVHVDARDTIALGGPEDLEQMHYLSLTGGLEFRFGVSPNVYYPSATRGQSAW